MSLIATSYTWGISEFITKSREKFDIDQPYQRGSVWGIKRKQNLIRSLIMGIPVGVIVINDRFNSGFSAQGYDQNRNWAKAVIDGKQRFSAITEFSEDGFSVPASWFDDQPEDKEVLYSELNDSDRRRFGNNTVPVAFARLSDLEQEEMVFNLINFGGVPQGESDI